MDFNLRLLTLKKNCTTTFFREDLENNPIIYFTAAPSDNLLKLRHNFDLNEVTVLQHKMKEQFPNVFYVKAKEKSYQFEVKEVYKASM